MAAITAFFQRSDVYDKVKPYLWSGQEIEFFPNSNFNMEERELNLTDMRTVPCFKPTIEENGFCFVENQSKEIARVTGPEDCKSYLEEMSQLLRERFGTSEVWAINAKFRGASTTEGCTARLLFAHLDNTADSSWERISPFLTIEERERILSGQTRARVVNIWRPMRSHSEDIPLAVCDPKTITDLGDVVSVDRVSPEATRELAYFAWNSDHRWYWLSNQTSDEIVIMTQYDTHPPGGMFNIVPHAAFRNGAARPGCPTRHSVEVRFIVLETAPYVKKGCNSANSVSEDLRAQPWKNFVAPPQPRPVPAPTIDNRPLYL